MSANQGWDRSSSADGLFSGSYLRICLSISITDSSSPASNSQHFSRWKRVSKGSGGNNSKSGPLAIRLDCSPFDPKYRCARSHWERYRSGKGPSVLSIISIWLSSFSLGITGNNGIPVSNSNIRHPKLQMSMLWSRGLSKIRSGARRLSGVSGFLDMSSNLNAKSELNAYKYWCSAWTYPHLNQWFWR